MQQQFCYIQSAFRLALQIPQNNWVSAREIFPQHKGFQELPREVRKAAFGISCPRIHGGTAQAAAPDFSLSLSEATGRPGGVRALRRPHTAHPDTGIPHSSPR